MSASLRQAVEYLKQRHIDYIEATYHIRHRRLIRERQEELKRSGGVTTHPWLEATPSYKKDRSLDQLKLPEEVRKILKAYAKDKLGVIDPPYSHQSEALESLFTDDKELVIATGTGSGKTEVFLYSILGLLAQEAIRGKSPGVRGMRAIVLYPMNALVSDQLARLRRFLGEDLQAKTIHDMFGRTVQFGMYTSRTPYHGKYDVGKNDTYVKSVIKYYAGLQTDNPELYKELRSKGRIPAKDLAAFANEKAPRIQRYQTQPGDRELFTRQEMHSPNEFGGAPDVLITNYSMLEYMLMRPIEQPLFRSTREWLDTDPKNKLLLVIDEAHLYRGAQGAEVAMLIRRLVDHLQVKRSRIRCILTSASLGSEQEATATGRRFAADLTAGTENEFQVILGKRIRFEATGILSKEFATALQAVTADVEPQSLRPLFSYFGWKNYTDDKLRLQRILGESLGKTQEFKIFHDALSRHARKTDELGRALFPGVDDELSSSATLNLALVSTFARTPDETPLLPVRLHVMFRGLPKHYACVNPNCPGRRITDEAPLLGKLFFAPQLYCDVKGCDSRVYELMTHRTCGAAYLKAFILANKPGEPPFLWSESEADELQEIHLLMEPPRGDPDKGGKKSKENKTLELPLIDKTRRVYLDRLTGFVLDKNPQPLSDRFVSSWWPPDTGAAPKLGSKKVPEKKVVSLGAQTFGRCPACGIDETGRPSKIQDLETSGENPFANVVKTLFQVQPPKPESKLPNKGKKVLCFSDGRQKAARLARDLQRAVQQDAFREVLILAAGATAIPLSALFASFVIASKKHQLVFFDNGDQRKGPDGYDGSRSLFLRAQDHVDTVLKTFQLGSDQDIVADKYACDDLSTLRPRQFNQELLRALGDRYYSVRGTLTGVVEPIPTILAGAVASCKELNPELVRSIILASIESALEKRALDPEVSNTERRLSRSTPGRPGWEIDEGVDRDKLIPGDVQEALENRISPEQFDRIRGAMLRGLFIGRDAKWWLNPEALVLRPAIHDDWWRCLGCGTFSTHAFEGRCPEPVCQSDRLEKVKKDDLYVNARKNYLRKPVEQLLQDKGEPFVLRSEEHTAQLNTKDLSKPHGRAEEYELLFQDVLVQELAKERPVDVLSCTTTMEVGIDIGSLTAVALRTVPPRADNYQQRSGRAGRRGTALSMIVTYADTSPYETFIFENPHEMIGRDPAAPVIYVGNAKIAERHLNASIIQTFFHRKGPIGTSTPEEAAIFESLGKASDFFVGAGEFSIGAFQKWLATTMKPNSEAVEELGTLFPDKLRNGLEYGKSSDWRSTFVVECGKKLGTRLEALRTGSDWSDLAAEEDNLLSALLDNALLPTFSFPLDLCTFAVREYDRGRGRAKNEYEMTQDLGQALSEYAPGRELVVDKRTYVSYGLYFPFPKDSINRAKSDDWDQLPWLNSCDQCGTILSTTDKALAEQACPVCGSGVIEAISRVRPLGFSPRVGTTGPVEGSAPAGDRERVYATAAEFPAPVVQTESRGEGISTIGMMEITRLPNQSLVVANFGPKVNGKRHGYTICRDCGAIALDGALPMPHQRPYPIEFRKGMMGVTSVCKGPSIQAALAFEFQTDLAIFRIPAKAALDYGFGQDQAWFRDAAKSLSEALVLGATRALGIDRNELSGGHRTVRPYLNDPKDVEGQIEFFLYDETAGGAGFAARAGENAARVLEQVDKVLDCTCGASCSRCLRTYDNRIHHGRLNRHYARALLSYAKTGSVPPLDVERTRHLGRVLSAAVGLRVPGATIEEKGRNQFEVRMNGKTVLVDLVPALAKTKMALTPQKGITQAIVKDYDVEHTLPRVVTRVANALR